MYFIIIHVISAITLFLLTIALLLAKSNKRISTIMGLNRILYVIFLVTGVKLSFWTFNEHPVLTVIKFLLAFALIAFIEILASRKVQSKISIKQILPVLILFVIVTVIGFIL